MYHPIIHLARLIFKTVAKKYLLGGGAGKGWTALWSRGEGAHQEEETFRIQDTEEN